MPASAPLDQVHIASLVVHALPDRAGAVAGAIGSLPGAQVHAATAAGKLVVTLEADSDGAMLDAIGAIQRLDGVMTAALVYQCAESRAAMEQEMTDAYRPA